MKILIIILVCFGLGLFLGVMSDELRNGKDTAGWTGMILVVLGLLLGTILFFLS